MDTLFLILHREAGGVIWGDTIRYSSTICTRYAVVQNDSVNDGCRGIVTASAVADSLNKIVKALGVDQTSVAATRLHIYPNPATGFITIDNIPVGLTFASIYDLQGHLVQRQTITRTPSRISLQDRPSGSYLIRLQFKDGKSYDQLFQKRE
jgi:hypothetical protein